VRDRTQVLRLFDGFDLVEPGLVSVTRWRPDTPPPPCDAPPVVHAGVGRLAAPRQAV
jgi:hypothetical protein